MFEPITSRDPIFWPSPMPDEPEVPIETVS